MHPVSHCLLLLFSFNVALPLTDSDNLKNKNFTPWLRARETIEYIEEDKRIKRDTTPHNLVDFPTSNDVLFKAGTALRQHRGNTQYRDLLMAHYDCFSTHGLAEKKHAAVRQVMDAVKQQGGRFLEWSTNVSCWVIMDDPVQIQRKIYNSMSYLEKSTQQSKRNLQSSSSSTFMFERQDGKKRKRLADGEEPSCCTNGWRVHCG